MILCIRNQSTNHINPNLKINKLLRYLKCRLIINITKITLAVVATLHIAVAYLSFQAVIGQPWRQVNLQTDPVLDSRISFCIRTQTQEFCYNYKNQFLVSVLVWTVEICIFRLSCSYWRSLTFSETLSTGCIEKRPRTIMMNLRGSFKF